MSTLVLKRLSFVKRLVRDLPRQVKIAYCLLLDERVPALNKIAVVAALGLIVTPFVNLPEWIPVIGEMDVLALVLVSTRLFIGSVSGELVSEHEQLIKERRSRFDLDVARGERVAVALAGRFRREGRGSEIEFVGVAQDRQAAATQNVSAE